jgi:hypothetical protein
MTDAGEPVTLGMAFILWTAQAGIRGVELEPGEGDRLPNCYRWWLDLA